MATPSGQDRCDGSHGDDATDEHPASSKHGLDDTNSPSPSHLENLPAELGVMVLSNMPDLPTLRAVVRASPVMHARYRLNRTSILRACLARELDGFLVDAFTTAAARMYRTEAWDNVTVPGFLYHYDYKNDIRWLAAYHLSVARPLARLYSNWALANLKKEALSSTGQQGAVATEANEVVEEQGEEGPAGQDNHNIELSRSEEIRIFRALYRYETYHHVFSRNRGEGHRGFPCPKINDLFFALFDPWEAEAIGCIHTFVRLRYEDIFNQVKADLHPRNAKLRQENGVDNLQGSYDLDAKFNDYMEGTISRGLRTTAQLLVIDDHEKLVSKMRRCLTQFQGADDPMSAVLGQVAQIDRREVLGNPSTAQDDAEERRDSMHFVGDVVPPDGPPFAWVVLWGGKYANIYGEFVPPSLHRWGYVMWDERRWVNMGVDGNLIARQWETSRPLVNDIWIYFDWTVEGY